jgi:hypothetical protein
VGVLPEDLGGRRIIKKRVGSVRGDRTQYREHSLSGPDVADQKPVHRPATRQIGRDLAPRTLLIPGQLKRQLTNRASDNRRSNRQRPGRSARQRRASQLEPQLEQEQLLCHQAQMVRSAPFPELLRVELGIRQVDLPYRVSDLGKSEVPRGLCRQPVLE